MFAFVPPAGAAAWPLVVVGLLFSLAGVAGRWRSRANKGLAVTGAVLSTTGLLACVAGNATGGETGDRAQHPELRIGKPDPAKATHQHIVVFELTTYQAVTVHYGDIDEQRSIMVGPAKKWQRELGFGDGSHRLALSATPVDSDDFNGFDGTITCSITIDGTKVVQRSSSFSVWCNASVDK